MAEVTYYVALPFVARRGGHTRRREFIAGLSTTAV
jgi:hypothetical protein